MTPTAPAGYHARAMDRFRKCVREFGYTRTAGDKMPRANAWRPYRFAIRDVIFFVAVMRHSKPLNAIEVDVLLTAEIQHYPPLSGAKAAMLLLLSEAFRVGSAMSVHFTEEVGFAGFRVPLPVCLLAARHGVALTEEEVKAGVIPHAKGRRLYAALTGFPPDLRARIDRLERDGLLSLERACYLIHHGVWTLPEMEGLIAGAPYPDLVHSGDVLPEQYHLYRHVQTHGRAALLGGYLDRALAQRAPDDVDADGNPVGRDAEDDERNLSARFDPGPYARVYRCEDEDAPLPAWEPGGGSGTLPAGQYLVALLRPRDAAGLERHLAEDLKAAAELKEKHPGVEFAVLVPFDFSAVDEKVRQAAVAAAGGVRLLVCPETTRGLDADLQKKLARSRVLRD